MQPLRIYVGRYGRSACSDSNRPDLGSAMDEMAPRRLAVQVAEVRGSLSKLSRVDSGIR